MLCFLVGTFAKQLRYRPEELIVRESYNISLWQFLRMDPSTPLCFVKFVEADGDGAKFRAALWQSRQVVNYLINVLTFSPSLRVLTDYWTCAFPLLTIPSPTFGITVLSFINPFTVCSTRITKWLGNALGGRIL